MYITIICHLKHTGSLLLSAVLTAVFYISLSKGVHVFVTSHKYTAYSVFQQQQQNISL